MKRFARALLFRALRLSLLPTIVRETLQRRTVTIILYHRVRPERAAQHFRAFRSRYSIIPLSRFVAAHQEGRVDELPSKSLVITLDDGHLSNLDLLPILRELAIPVTIFLCSRIVGTRRHFWFLHGPTGQLVRELERVPDREREERLRRAGFDKEREFDDRQALTANEIQQMSECVDFQGHTMFHPVLPMCDDDVVRREIAQSKADLEAMLGASVYSISYPGGFYSDRELRMSKAAGYTCGLTVDPGFNSARTDLFELKRICIGDEDDVSGALVKATGIWAFAKRLLARPQRVRSSG